MIEETLAPRASDMPRDQFLQVLAHELRNPLAPLRIGVQIIRLAKDDPLAVERALDVMDRQLQQMVTLIDDLLDASRVNQGDIELHREAIDLAVLINDAAETCQRRLQETDHMLNVQMPSEPVLVSGDKRRLVQVVVNLLENAIKYSGRGSRIEVLVQRVSDAVTIRIRDHGIGIPFNMLESIFQMFVKADRSLDKVQDGLGIGLAVAKSIVEMHGGEIEALSQGPGAGSEFVISLPSLNTKEADSYTSEPVRIQPDAPIKSEGKRVLIVDDNEDTLLSMSMMLQFMGHETKTAADGVAALREASIFQPNVILLDIGMPKLNGYDACRIIREQPWGQDVVLVALTGWGQEEDKEASRQAGFDYHLVKPVESFALQQIVLQPRRTLS